MTIEKYATDQASLERDTDVTFFRGSGPGGQNRNKVETGVQLFYRPLEITIRAGERSSQARNRKIAFGRLRNTLKALNKPHKQRFPTAVPMLERKKRLREKLFQARVKQDRQPPHPEE